MLLEEINNWLINTNYEDFLNDIKKNVIGQDNLSIFCANVYNYLLNIVYDLPINHNTIIAAPSGSGKTQTYRVLHDYFRTKIPSLPIYSFDLSALTATGFRGAEPTDIIEPLFNTKEKKPTGIIFLDEFDKKLIPSYTSNGHDVNLEAQNCILTLIEGSYVTNKRDNKKISTEKIMFVGLGSFDSFRENKSKERESIGFSNKNKEKRQYFEYITRDDMFEAGGSNELLGRFPLIINYDELSEKSIEQIIDRCGESISDMYDCTVNFEKEFIDELKKSANSKYGCRLIESIIRNCVLNQYSKALLEKNNADRLVITINSKDDTFFKWQHYTEAEKQKLMYEKWDNYILSSVDE